MEEKIEIMNLLQNKQLLEHELLEKVDTAIVQVKSFVENEEIPSAIAELETGKFVLEHIERKYKFKR